MDNLYLTSSKRRKKKLTKFLKTACYFWRVNGITLHLKKKNKRLERTFVLLECVLGHGPGVGRHLFGPVCHCFNVFVVLLVCGIGGELSKLKSRKLMAYNQNVVHGKTFLY